MNRQQETDKHARIAMMIISGIIIFLFVIALSGCSCYNVCDYEKYESESVPPIDSTKVVLIISEGDTTRVIDPTPW